VFRKNVPPAHAGYMYSGIDAEVTLKANREAFAKYYLRPRRLVDVSKVDTSVEIFGVKYANPIFVCPTGGNRAYHPDGELAVARAAKAGGHLEMLATPATTSIEDAIAARGAPVWYQLYASPRWEVAEALVKRAERAGAPVVVVTVDRVGGRNQEPFIRMRRKDTRDCAGCHPKDLQQSVARKPAYAGIDLSGLTNTQSANMTWDFIKRLRGATKMKIVIKGILTAEDAKLCVENGVDGLVVSNHGGRGEDSGRATIDVLPEVVDVVQGRILVLVDGGFRRGTDAAKALAMGANAVGVGRPYLWGLGAFGEPGVAKVLELLRTETRVAMMQCGVRAVKEFTPAFVRRV
jgi:isopentenyl diphosphate isomerase/L-lactate dehydrogenase-like FMN-dependent dehydrogenase